MRVTHVHAGVESSAAALELAESNAQLNGCQKSQYTFLKNDIVKYMQQQAAESRTWDLVVLDPPKLAPNRKSVNRALRKYCQLNTLVGLVAISAHDCTTSQLCCHLLSLSTPLMLIQGRFVFLIILLFCSHLWQY